MLSDKGSVVIRKFGILNANVPPDVTRFYGIPFPGQYLLAADGTVKDKVFLADYQERPTASQVLLTDFDTSVGNNGVVVKADDVTARVILSDARSFSGHQLGLAVDFDVAPGWHIYGNPVPQEYTPTSVKLDDDLVSAQSLNFPKPTPVKFELLGETLPVYQGAFKTAGSVLLKQKLSPGDHKLAGTVSFQECNDSLCKIPRTVRFELPIRIEALTAAAPKK
jgi:DsbC/DsbD-like thiol-disulfide interchange protein